MAALQSHLSLLAAAPRPALEAQAAALLAVAAEVAVQRTVAELAAAELHGYPKCWDSLTLGRSLDQCCVAVRPLPDSSR